MLLTLLPFTAWGTLVKVTPYNINKYYGQDDPSLNGLVFDTSVELSGINEAILRAGLYVSRNGANAGEAVGDYTYTLGFDADLITTTTSGATGEQIETFFENYSVAIQGSGTLSIRKMPLNNAAIEVAEIPVQNYTGSAIEPELVVINRANGEHLEAGVDFTVNWAGTNITGPAAGTLTAKGSKYSGTRTADVAFVIKKSIAGANVIIPFVDPLTFNGAAQEPDEITVELGGVALTEDVDYVVSYSNSVTGNVNPTTNAGTVTLTVTAKENSEFTGSASTTYVIQPLAVDAENIAVTFEDEGNVKVYTGEPIRPTNETVKIGNTELTVDVDYEITNLSTNRSTVEAPATATVNLKGNYSGSKTIEYTINPKAITTPLNILFEQESNTLNTYVYKKAPIQPGVTVYNGLAALDASNYVLRFDNDDNEENDADLESAGVKTVHITPSATSNYTFDENTKDYTVAQRPLTISVSNMNVGVGSLINPQVTISNLAGEPSEITLKNTDGLNEELNGTITFTYNQGGGNLDPADAGEYNIVPLLAAPANEDLNPNYTYNYVNGTLTIIRSQIIVAVNDASMTYSGDVPAFTLKHVSGLGAGEIATFMAALNARVSGTYTADEANEINAALDGAVAADADVPVDYVEKVGTAAAGETLTEDEANLYNATLEGAVHEGGAKVGKFTYDAETMKNVGTYDINYKENDGEVGFITDANYTITVQNGTLTVNAKNVTPTITIAAMTYTGTTQEPVITVKDGTTEIDPSEYTVSFSQLVNAGTNHTATVTDKAGGNYNIRSQVSGKWVSYKTQPYSIARVPLTVTADAGTWVYGSAEKDFTFTIDRSALVEVDKTKTDAQLGIDESTIKIDIIAPLTVGEHNNGLMPSSTANPNNYSYQFVAGKLTITKGNLVARVKEKTVEYGAVANTDEFTAFELEAVSGMLAEEAANFNDIVTYSNDFADYDYDAETMSDVNTDGYLINYKGAKPTATNYNVVVTSGLLKVAPRKITVKSLDQEITLNANPAQSFDAVPSLDDPESEEDVPTVAITEGRLIGEDVIGDIIQELTAERNVEDPNIINIVLKVNPKYEVTIDTENAGYLTINEGEILYLGVDEATELAQINEWAASEYQVKVKMNFAKRSGQSLKGERKWAAENWNTLVLPFDITVAELSKVLGYAVVNVIDASGAQYNNGDPIFKFKLTMKGGNGSNEVLKANRPFVVKTTDAINDDENFFYDFGSRKIVAPTTDDAVNAGLGCTFNGTYETKHVDYTSEGKVRFLTGNLDKWIGLTSQGLEWNVVPFAGFIDLSNLDADAAARATFIMEEADGSTTAIRSINADEINSKNAEGIYNLNGVKLNSVPSQKGVYIQNGKKIVVK